MTRLRDDLIAAKALIDTPEKWCQGVDDQRYCAMFAVNEVCDGSRIRWNRAEGALLKVLKRREAGGCHPVVAFNDAPSTTHADIMALFDRAIAAAGNA